MSFYRWLLAAPSKLTRPKPERLTPYGDLEKAVAAALAIKRAAGGWPKPDKKKPGQ